MTQLPANIHPYDEAAASPPREHRPRIEALEHALDPEAPTVFIEQIPDGGHIETDHTVSVKP